MGVSAYGAWVGYIKPAIDARTDRQFLNAVNYNWKHDPRVNAEIKARLRNFTPQEAIKTGHQVCADLKNGSDRTAAFQDLSGQGKIWASISVALDGIKKAATTYYCPEFGRKP